MDKDKKTPNADADDFWHGSASAEAFLKKAPIPQAFGPLRPEIPVSLKFQVLHAGETTGSRLKTMLIA